MAEPLRKYESSRPELTPVDVGPTERIVSVERPLVDYSLVRQAYRVLKFGFTVAPIIAGADKFFHLLVNWDQYLSPIVPSVLKINPHSFMLIVGVIEIVAGIGVALKPKIFAYVVSAWLIGITINLLTTGSYFDIALRDFGLALGAFALGRLSQSFDRKPA